MLTFLLIFIPILILVFFGYKLVQSMQDKEKKREEKKKRKLEKTKKAKWIWE